MPTHSTLDRLFHTRIRLLAQLLLALFFTCALSSAQSLPSGIGTSVPRKPDFDEGSPNLPKLPTIDVPPGGAPEVGTVGVPPDVKKGTESDEPQPFGANLFMGNFLRTRQNGLNPDYRILPGDQVAVHTWGAVALSQVFVVDGQGNIFIPGVGPISLQGVRNADLTSKVRAGLQRVYARHLEVYTNLITANPVAVFVTGGVPRPGRYAGIPSDSVLFFLDQAGGIDPKLGSYRRIDILREGATLASIDLYDFILSGVLPALQFKDGDTILVGRRGPVVELKGNVARPTYLEFLPDAPLTGTLALEIVPNAALATQVTLYGIRDGFPINRTLSLNTFAEFPLQDGDSITIREDGRTDMIVVNIEGEFEGPSQLAVVRGSRLVDVLNHVPVEPLLADTSAVHLKRNSIARVQKDAIDDALFRLERSALLALSQSNGESNIRAKEAELALRFAERARLVQPLGRVVTSHQGDQQNVLLEDGDVIVVPRRTNVVTIGGEVMMAQAVMFQPDLTADDYVELAGGYTDRADEDKVILIHPDASVTVGGPTMRVLPGDEVLVPPRVDIKTLQNVADITQIIYQIAVSAAVVLAIL